MRGVPIPDREEDFTADPVELFFDLSFVFAFGQLVSHLVHHPDWTGVWQFFVLFTLMWFAWSQFTWAANAVAGNTRPIRLIFLVATACSVPMAGAVGTAFGDGGRMFAASVALIMTMPLVTNMYTLRDDPTLRRATITFSIPGFVAIGFVLAGGLVSDDARVWFWLAAFAVMAVALGRAGNTEWLVRPGHFSERHGLIVIVALGEIIVAVGLAVVGAIDDGVSALTSLGLMAAGVFAGLLWWAFFDRAHPAFEYRHHAIDDPIENGRFARNIYTLAHWPIVGGILLAAAAVEETVLHPDVPLEAAFRWMFFAGIALFFGGVVIAVAVSFRGAAIERFVGVGAMAVLLALLSEVNGVWLLVAVDVLLFVLLLTEHYRVEVAHKFVSLTKER